MKMENKKFRAAIFDMDGVIVDSEIVYNEYLLAFAQTKNPAVVMDDINPMVGRTKKDSWMIMERAVGNGQTWEELLAEFRLLDIYSQVDYKKIFRQDALTVVKELKKRGYRVALASSTGPKLIARIMEETGMRPWFDLIVSGGQFKQSKPDPEIYHYTAKTLKVREEECFVIEDSEVGIEAGKAAGMTVAAIRDDRFGFDQGKADHHMDSLLEILDYLP
ncbi:MAG: HAD family phosphatase [Lachnospiraceae bacterium]|nr:HAD family phosphatase [Lachnospiraceae bacterium]